MGVNPVTFAARSFRPRQGASCFRTGTRAYPDSGSVRSEQRRLALQRMVVRMEQNFHAREDLLQEAY